MPEPQVHEKKRSGFEGGKEVPLFYIVTNKKNLVIIEANILCKARLQREEPICTTSLVMYTVVLMK